MTQVFDILLEYVPLKTFKSKPNLLMKHRSLKVLVAFVAFGDLLVADSLEIFFGLQDGVPRTNKTHSQMLPWKSGQIMENLDVIKLSFDLLFNVFDIILQENGQ